MPKNSYTTIPLMPTWASSCSYCDWDVIDKPEKLIYRLHRLHHKIKHPDKKFIWGDEILTKTAKNGECKKILQDSIKADRQAGLIKAD